MAAGLKLLIDEDVHLALSSALRKRGYDAVHVRELERLGLEDVDQLDCAIEQERCFVTFNVGDFVRLHAKYIEAGKTHFGIVVSQQLPIGRMLRDLLLFFQTRSPEEIRGGLHFL